MCMKAILTGKYQSRNIDGVIVYDFRMRSKIVNIEDWLQKHFADKQIRVTIEEL